MITLRPARERGHAEHGWLESWHTFSFAAYHDPLHMGFRDLRVINEDRVQPGKGFGTHSHRDMEILSYVIDGALEHRDSLGNGSVIRPHEVQRMSAGSGISHSEFNASRSELVHFLQIWILPEREGIAPGYEQRAFPPEERRGCLRLVASRDGREGSVTIHQDVSVLLGLLPSGARVEHPLRAGRHAWVQLVRGGIELGGRVLAAGDGAAISGEAAVRLEAKQDSEAFVFDLA
jgi:redox-sensitive bicupin YhaK (pirin superfamily)